ncbi:hypothetical protein AAG906_030661 [Vitis piasezkii]
MVTNMKEWVVDSEATRHICGNRSAFTSYTTVKKGEEQVFMSDSRSTLVIGKGKVLLKLTSGKVLVLCDVLHVPDICWNLVLVSLLGKAGVNILFDFDKIILTKNDAFVGKGYCNQGLFMLNVFDIINNTSSSFAYIVDSCDIWHDDYSRYTRVYLLRNKDEARDAFIKYKNEVENQLNHGIIHETIPPYSPKSNGIVERKNRTLKEMMNAMLEAINSEIESIMCNHTWELVDLPIGAKTIASSIRVLIALASIHNLVIHQMDVKNTFLNRDLEEEIYMDQLEGCVVIGKEKKVLTNGYSINDAGKCIYSKYEDNTCVVICLYVDDMLIFGTNLEVVCETKKFLGSKFDMKDLGETKVILGIKITRTPNGLKLSQEHYVEKILRKFEHFDCKPKNREHSVAQIEYAQIIGSLMYLMNCTRPDIAYADHWTVVHRVLKYLRGTINYGLCFSGFPSVLEGFSDANWILDSDEMKSTSGYIFILGRSVVS